jgi:hypothetical protein
VAVYFLGHWLSPTFGCEGVPQWFFLLSACSLLFYQTLDNMDGKQVRWGDGPGSRIACQE